MKRDRPIIHLKRVYDKPARADGRRILVDRLWPRGLSKERAKIDVWLKELAPSTALRRWYGHDPKKWAEFKRRYAEELDANPEQVQAILAELRAGTVTLLYGTKEEKFNNAMALKDYIASMNDDEAGS